MPRVLIVAAIVSALLLAVGCGLIAMAHPTNDNDDLD